MKREKLFAYRNGRPQSVMANMYGVTQQTWSMWEKGTWKPNVVTMKKLEADSGIPMEELFADVFNK
jgi:DNA-binding XRE family transcriptional regulator